MTAAPGRRPSFAPNPRDGAGGALCAGSFPANTGAKLDPRAARGLSPTEFVRGALNQGRVSSRPLHPGRVTAVRGSPCWPRGRDHGGDSPPRAANGAACHAADVHPWANLCSGTAAARGRKQAVPAGHRQTVSFAPAGFSAVPPSRRPAPTRAVASARLSVVKEGNRRLCRERPEDLDPSRAGAFPT